MEQRRTEDDLYVAREVNTEGWPDTPEVHAQLLAHVWKGERILRQIEERNENRRAVRRG